MLYKGNIKKEVSKYMEYIETPYWRLKKPEPIVSPPTGMAKQEFELEHTVSDLEACLRGDATSKRWQELNRELTNKKQELLHVKRRLAGRTPQMASWADPL